MKVALEPEALGLDIHTLRSPLLTLAHQPLSPLAVHVRPLPTMALAVVAVTRAATPTPTPTAASTAAPAVVVMVVVMVVQPPLLAPVHAPLHTVGSGHQQ
jgi:hypothetical protein